MFITIFSQIHWLAKALQNFDAVFIVPVFQCSFITFASIGGGIYFQEFWNFSLVQSIGFPMSIATVVGGVLLLSMRDVSSMNNDKVELLDAQAAEEHAHDIKSQAQSPTPHPIMQSPPPPPPLRMDSVSSSPRASQHGDTPASRSKPEPSPRGGKSTATPPQHKRLPPRGSNISRSTNMAWQEKNLRQAAEPGLSLLFAMREIKRHLGGRHRQVGPSSATASQRRSSSPVIRPSSPRDHMSINSVGSSDAVPDTTRGQRGNSPRGMLRKANTWGASDRSIGPIAAGARVGPSTSLAPVQEQQQQPPMGETTGAGLPLTSSSSNIFLDRGGNYSPDLSTASTSTSSSPGATPPPEPLSLNNGTADPTPASHRLLTVAPGGSEEQTERDILAETWDGDSAKRWIAQKTEREQQQQQPYPSGGMSSSM